MKNLSTNTSIISLALALTACSSAPKSNEVSAAYVPVAQYQTYTCEQLVSEAESVRRSIPALEAAVDKHRSNQTGVEVVTWILFWPAAFALDKGEEISSQLGKARGELQSLQTALMSRKCDITAQSSVKSNDKTDAKLAEGANAENTTSVVDKLKALDQMRKDGFINESEYSNKRKEILEKI